MDGEEFRGRRRLRGCVHHSSFRGRGWRWGFRARGLGVEIEGQSMAESVCG